MPAPVRCSRCAHRFEVALARFGRNERCPACAGYFTARPLAVDVRCREREREPRGSRQASREAGTAVLVDDVRSLWNVGAIFRTADGLGIDEVVLCGITGSPPDPRIAKTALGAEAAVPWIYRADAGRAADELAERGYALVALERSSRSIPLEGAQLPRRPAIVVGNEVAGVSAPVLERCGLHVHIPMSGTKESLNVAVAFGIAAWTVARARSREPVGTAGPSVRHDWSRH